MNTIAHPPIPARPRGNPTFPPRSSRRHRHVLAALVAAGAVLATTTDAVDARVSVDDDRPHVTFVATPEGLIVPAEVPGGLVDITLETEAEPGSSVGHHLVIARLDDGVTLDAFLA